MMTIIIYGSGGCRNYYFRRSSPKPKINQAAKIFSREREKNYYKSSRRNIIRQELSA